MRLFLCGLAAGLCWVQALCGQELAPAATLRVNSPAVTPIPQPFALGISRLRAEGFAALAGKRVGLLTHTAATDEQGRLTIDILKEAPGVNLVALYSPEHGLDGLTRAEEHVEDGSYQGLPVYSLYGDTRKPTPDMLEGLEVMVIDLQDVGVRSYTYISAMKYTLEACFERNMQVIVLDRPNPLGGLKVDGPLLDPRFKSYVGSYRIPYVHGLTIGELARVARGELVEDGKITPRQGVLTVVKMQGWRRNMVWSDITLENGQKLKWRATSPAVPTLGAAFGYAFAGLGAQLGDFSHGYGTEYPFRLLSHPELPPAQLKARLERAQIPGFTFQTLKIPRGQRGAGEEGVYVRINNWSTAQPMLLSLTMLQIAQELEGAAPFAQASRNEKDLFNKHWGRAEPLRTLSSDKPLNAERLARHWQAEALRWQAQIRPLWLYY